MDKIFESKFGSHLYGTDTEYSDLDLKSVYVPCLSDVILGKYKDSINSSTCTSEEKNSSRDIDNEIFSIHKFLTLLLQGQAVAIDMFFTPEQFIIRQDERWELIKSHKNDLISKSIYPYIGYCRSQANKYGIKGSKMADAKKVIKAIEKLPQQSRVEDHWDLFKELANSLENCEITFEKTRNMGDQWLFSCCDKKVQTRNKLEDATRIYQKLYDDYGQRARMAENNKGIDWKALSHAIRVADEAIELLDTHRIEFPLKNANFLLSVKRGEYDFRYVGNYIEERFDMLEHAMKYSTLPKKPDWGVKDEIILKIYGVEAKNA